MRQPAIDQLLYHGRAFNLRVSMPFDDIRSTVRSLFEELSAANVDYLLVGGVALLSYVEGRNTQDVDLIVDPADLGRVPLNAVIRDRDFGEATYRGLQVDLLLTTNPLFARVKAHRRAVIDFGQLQIPCASREGLLLLKLYALPSLYRQAKLARAALYETDILMLHQGVEVDDESLLAELGAHLLPGDVAELGRILAEQRSRSRFVE